MKKFKLNKSGMTIVEILVAMTLLAMMFMIVFGYMLASVKLNAQTRTYDQEVDVQVEDAERYNPMAATVNGSSSSSSNVSSFSNQQIDFNFGGRVISINTDAYQADSRDPDNNGFQLKFFSDIGPDTANGKYWIRIFNVQLSSTDTAEIFLYLPSESGSFYVKNESTPYTSVVSKKIPIDTALGVGYDMSGAASGDYFFVSTTGTLSQSDYGTWVSGDSQIYINSANLSDYDAEGDGYIDIYYTDDGLKSYDEYQEYLTNLGSP